MKYFRHLLAGEPFPLFSMFISVLLFVHRLANLDILPQRARLAHTFLASWSSHLNNASVYIPCRRELFLFSCFRVRARTQSTAPQASAAPSRMSAGAGGWSAESIFVARRHEGHGGHRASREVGYGAHGG